MINIEDLYATTDLSLTATLCLYYPLVGLKFNSPKQATFYFLKSDDLLTSVGQYWTHEIRVDPVAYFLQLKQLKSRLYADISGGRV